MPRRPLPADLGPTPPPTATTEALDALSAGLEPIPGKRRGHNLLIGTWNIALLSRVNPGWVTKAGDDPQRNLTDICCMAEVVSRFDVCAIQENLRSLEALRCVLRVLGEHWGFIISDVTEGDLGKSERLCFVYDRRRIEPSGLAGEIVIPLEGRGASPGGLRRQFARTPYAVSFSAGSKAFTLVTLHVYYGETRQEREERAQELRGIAEWLAARAKEPDEFNRNLIALGDFNIDRYNDPLWQAFASTGLGAPKELEDVPRNIAAAGGGDTKHYDQIAWFTRGNREQLTLSYKTAGYVRWTDFILRDARDDDARKAHISDHYPLWAEFGLQ